MKTIIITDVNYRFSISAIRSLGLSGYNIVVTQTKKDCHSIPAAFYSKYVSETYMIEGSYKDKLYKDKLIKIISKYNHPTLFCMGSGTLRVVATNINTFSKISDFTISNIKIIDLLNDKQVIYNKAKKLNIPTPIQYNEKPKKYPVIIKPHCGELLGLNAKDRYEIVNNENEYHKKLNKIKLYDNNPIIQEKITGEAIGVCILIDKKGNLVNAYCHRRIREYPITGGPSTCCESFYDEQKILQAYELLKSFNFIGYAMVEFKGNYILEVNPRIWGSFPLAEAINSKFSESYINISKNKNIKYYKNNFNKNIKIHFILNDILSILSYLKNNNFKKAFLGIKDMIMIKDALYDKHDKKPFFKYIKNSLVGK